MDYRMRGVVRFASLNCRAALKKAHRVDAWKQLSQGFGPTESRMLLVGPKKLPSETSYCQEGSHLPRHREHYRTVLSGSLKGQNEAGISIATW